MFPAEIVAVSRRGVLRLAIFDDSFRLGSLPSLAGASLAFLAALTTAPLASTQLTIALTATAFAATLLSPSQDHVRRTLHIADKSWQAAAMSLTQFLVTLAATGVMLLMDVLRRLDSVWRAHRRQLPFSLSWEWSSLRETATTPSPIFVSDSRNSLLRAAGCSSKPRFPPLPRSRPRTSSSISPSEEALGYAEAARIVAQPIVVLAAGLIYPLRPRAMEAALDRDLAGSIRVERIYITIVVLGGLAYIPLVGGAWLWNPMQYLVPAAYEVPGLVTATILANIVLASIFLLVNEMMAAGRGRTLAFINAIGGVVRIVAALSAGCDRSVRPPGGRSIRRTRRRGGTASESSRNLRGTLLERDPEA